MAGQVEDRLDPPERVVGKRRSEQLLQGRLVEEAQPSFIAFDRGAVSRLDRVGDTPAAANADVKDGVHRVDVVADRLDRETFSLLHPDVALDVVWLDLVQRLRSEERRDVVAEIRCHGHLMGLLALLDLETEAERFTCDVQRDATGIRCRHDRVLGFPKRSEAFLCGRPGQPIVEAWRACRPDAALDSSTRWVAPEAVPRAAD